MSAFRVILAIGDKGMTVVRRSILEYTRSQMLSVSDILEKFRISRKTLDRLVKLGLLTRWKWGHFKQSPVTYSEIQIVELHKTMAERRGRL